MTLLPPTVEQQKRIDEELPPDPEMRKRDIIAIKEWLAKQPHLPKNMGKIQYFNKNIIFSNFSNCYTLSLDYILRNKKNTVKT